MPDMNANDKVLALFHYINEFSNLKQKTIRNIRDQFWYKYLTDIPSDERYITVNKRNSSDSAAFDGILLEVIKPELKPCPMPDVTLQDWLIPGWENPLRDILLKEFKENIKSEDSSEAQTSLFDTSLIHDESPERFEDSDIRVKAYARWKALRDPWAEEQKQLIKIRDLFTSLYKLHVTLERDTDSKELLVGCGFLTDTHSSDLQHPILAKRVQTEFDSLNNTIRIVDTEVGSELYTALITSIEDFNLGVLPRFTDQLSINAFHPLNEDDVSEFLQQLIHSLSSDSQYLDGTEVQKSERFQLAFRPVFFVRSRNDGTPKAIEAIISDIKENGNIPSHILNLVGDGQLQIEEDTTEKTLSEQLAEVGGEDIDILLTKPANKEQLEIARRISKYDAVLVQGPPGTGKTHTIANLLGHFLSQGKTVLVTSHTKKALTVVKEKVETDLRDLCVAVLDENNTDMEKSVDGINEMISRYPLHELQDRITESTLQRKQIIQRLAQVRQHIFEIQSSEFSPIVIGGESISPAEAARFVHEHPEYDIIPGNVELYRVLPLSLEEFRQLYASNGFISRNEETELSFVLPNPTELPTPEEFKNLVDEMHRLSQDIHSACVSKGYSYHIDQHGLPEIIGETRIPISNPSPSGLTELNKLLCGFDHLEEWMIYAAVDGRKGGGHLANWETLISQIKRTVDFSESLVEEMFGKKITFVENANVDLLKKNLPDMLSILKSKGKLSKFDFLLHSEFKIVAASASINGKNPENYSDYALINNQLILQDMRNECAAYWNQLIASHGVASFEALHVASPETVAIKMIPEIEKYLNWYHDAYPLFVDSLCNLGISNATVFCVDALKTDVEEMQQILFAVDNMLPLLATVIQCYLRNSEIECYFQNTYESVLQQQRSQSETCRLLFFAVQDLNPANYKAAYLHLQELYSKYHILTARHNLLQKLYAAAPDWTHAIQHHIGPHGSDIVPENIDQIWIWKQYSEILKDLSKDSLPKLQSESSQLSKEYRVKTAELAKWKSWYHLKKRIDSNLQLKSSLQSWRLVTKRVGKARKMTGIYRQEAQNHMIKCQEAVPAWIVPMAKALENFTPGKNTFDVIIVDEASQSSISALAITYMAKKVIVVGDDKQVSPTGVGIDLLKMIKLAEGMIKDIIPAWSLYTGNSSLYDIVSTVYPSLMLREHFRCVPDIIGYSNKLSYDFKIKPLRDTSGCTLLPAVVNYQTHGHRNGKRKQNEIEARTIVALIKACIENEAYQDKTFGIISLLGDEQPRLIEKYLFEELDAAIIEKRRIIYGSPAQFQGDERDVIFLSLVDSNEEDGPLSLQGFGTDDMFRKRYNVAVSRAKDQLWVVHSLDSSRDLKDGDLRKDLIEYAKNPQAFQQQITEVMQKAESPFEEGVCKALVAKGYKIQQQWPVGSYRIDIVAIDGEKKVAIECDGDRWHSSDLQVRNDMERQTILERLGWRFIRIRGSEYFRDPEATMVRVYSELAALSIQPSSNTQLEQLPDTVLLSEIKRRAEEILSDNGIDLNPGSTAVAVQEALTDHPTSMVIKDEATTTSNSVTQPKIPIALNPKKDMNHSRLPLRSPIMIPSLSNKPEETVSAAPIKQPFLHNTSITEKPNIEIPKREAEKTANSTRTPVVTNKVKAVSAGIELPAKGEGLITELQKMKIEFIDNRKQSGILWIIHKPEEKEQVVALLEKLGCKSHMERRGAIATNNRPAWRVIF